MKKILLFVLMGIIGVISVGAIDSHDTFYYDTQVPNMYITKIKGSSYQNGAPFLIHRSDGTLVYCVQLFTDITGVTYDGYIGYNGLLGLSQEQIRKMNVIAHYGYGYLNHTDLKWYGLTQYLIWETLGLDDIYFTDVYHGKRITAYTSELNELRSLVNSYYVLPSFSGQNYKFSINNNYTITDRNNVLKDYKVTSSDSNLEVSVVGNNLNLKALKDGTYRVTFTKKDNSKNYMLYYSNSSQNFLLPGRIDDLSTTITINAYKGSISVSKHDIETDTKRENTTFENAMYGLYKEGTDDLVTTFYLDSEGKYKLDNLQLTNYYVKEISPPIGYQLSNKKYPVSLTIENRDISLDVYEEVISKEISIYKYYGNNVTDHYYLESGAIFELYDINNNLINTYKTDQDGHINFNLTYGKYYLRQITGKEGYTVNDDIILNVIDCKNERFDLYDYEIINYGKLIINKVGSDNKLLDGVEFGIYASNDIFGKDGSIYYHKDELIDKIKTINGVATYDKLYYGEYYLKELSGINGYKIDTDKKFFTIDKNETVLNLVNEKIFEKVDIKSDNYVSVPDTYKNNIDYISSISVLLILFGYCLGIYAYKKYYNNI